MSNVSIFEKKWIDLVFEGKNKEYGAYKLRQQSPKTTLLAFFFGMLFLFGLVITLSSFSNSTNNILPDSGEYGSKIELDGGKYPPEKEKEKTETKKKEIKDEIKKEDLNNLVVAKKDEKFVDLKTNDESKTNTNTSETGSNNGTGNSTGDVSGTGGGEEKTGNGIENKVKDKIEITALLDKQPEFPGGMKKFYDYVGNNFEKPNLDDVESISVLVSFVIEKDGSMSDIKVLRNVGYGLDKEAIRVLKALKTKWKPGVKAGENVRTQYTLPIKIQMN